MDDSNLIAKLTDLVNKLQTRRGGQGEAPEGEHPTDGQGPRGVAAPEDSAEEMVGEVSRSSFISRNSERNRSTSCWRSLPRRERQQLVDSSDQIVTRAQEQQLAR